MRLRVLALALLASATSAFAQTDSSARTGPTNGGYRLRAQLSLLRFMGYTETLPGLSDFTSGNLTIPKDSVVNHAIGVVDGSLDVFGTINGAVMAVDGNVRIHPGATINGDAVVVRGRIINQGGSVTGEARTLGTFATGSEPEPAQPRTTMWALKLTLGWFAVLFIIGVGVMIFAEANLDGVVLALERSVTKSFGVGVVGQLVALPGLALLCIGLALTILGVLLIPFAIVAYTIVVAGLVTLGFLAVARLSGAPLVRAPAANPRGINLRAMFIGLIGYFALWALAAAFTWQPVAGAVLRMLALVVTWVVATAGLGATLLSRAGTQRPGGRKARVAAADDYAWQTPTPVSGVAAGSRRKRTVNE